MNITLDQVLTFIGGGLVVFILEQVIQHFRREKRVLGYTLDSKVLIEKSHPDLKISYKGMDVSKVIFHSIVLRNVGNMCLKDFPVYIQGGGGKFYFAHTSAKAGIECKKIDSGPGFAFTVNLLNPEDEVKIELTLLDAVDERLVVDARAENLKIKNISSNFSSSEMLDVMIEGTSGVSWTLAKMLKLTLKDK